MCVSYLLFFLFFLCLLFFFFYCFFFFFFIVICVFFFFFFFFFFQAEDGIRDLYVTGVQTCALPICRQQKSTSNERGGLEGQRFGFRGHWRILQAMRVESISAMRS